MTRPAALALASLLMVLTLLIFADPAAGQGRITLRRPVIVTLVPPGIITANGAPQSLLFVVTDETGGLANEVSFRGSRADMGVLGNWTQLGPGVWTATYTVSPVSETYQAMLDVQAKVGKYKAQKQFPVLVQPAAAPRFTMAATPEVMVLGQDELSVLTFMATGPAGAPLDGLDLQLGASIGTVTDPTALGGGTYRAEFRPPADQKGPALVILSLVERESPETSTQFLSLPLVGKTEWKVEVGEQLVPVGMELAGQRFGPVVTDETGVAMVPIIVPPGVRTALAYEVDAEQNPVQPIPVDLRLPPFKGIEVAPMAAYIPGNGVAGFPVYVFVVGQDAMPMSNAPLQLEASLGDFVAVQMMGPGTYRATYVPPSVTAPTDVNISAVLLGETQNFGDRITVQVVPGPPGAMWFSTAPAKVSGGDQTVTLRGEVMVPVGEMAPGVGVAFANMDGVIPMEAATGDGTFEASLSANFDQPIPLSAEVTLPASERPVSALVAWPVMDQVPVNGQMPVVAMALDRYGLPVSGANLSATTLDNVGSVSGGGPTDAFGRAVFTFQATPLSGMAAVVITDGEHVFACPLWQASNLLLGFQFPLQGGAQQAGMMNMWGALRSRLLVGAGAPAPVEREAPPTAQAALETPQPGDEDEPAVIPTFWGDEGTAGGGSGGSSDPATVWAAEVKDTLCSGETETRALRDVNVVSTDDGKYDVVVRYSHAATVVTVAGQKVQLSVPEWFAGWATQVGAYTRSSDFRSRDFRLTNLDTGKTLVLGTSDCRSLASMSQERRVSTVESKARTE
jgi:hypothetical protein